MRSLWLGYRWRATNNFRWRPQFIALLCCFLLVSPLTAFTIEKPGEELGDVGVAPRLGGKIDLTLEFRNEKGERNTLGELFAGGKPIILTPVYYHCPRVCGVLLEQVTKLLNDLPIELGDDYKVVTFSYDPEETGSLAAKRAQKYRKLYRDPDKAATNWHFLLGEQSAISSLLEQIGFRVKRDNGEFAHSIAIMVMTPDGEISQYFTDINFPPWDVKLALVEASKGEIGSPLDHFLLYCFRFDVTKGKYTWAATTALRVGSVLTVFLLFVFIVWYVRRA